jgi:hypothetical protein
MIDATCLHSPFAERPLDGFACIHEGIRVEKVAGQQRRGTIFLRLQGQLLVP